LFYALKFWTGQEIEDIVLDVEARSLQEIDEIPIIQSHCPESLGALIPDGIWDPGISSDLNCAFIKGKQHDLIEPG